MHTGCSKFETQVLVIGNGPAGIALSAFLSGMHPFYNPHRPCLNPTVDEKLRENQHFSLLDQDLSWSTDLSEISQSGRPLSVLYDMLVRPGADTSCEESEGSLIWEMDRSREIDHMVIGETRIGGSWNEYDPEMLTVSFSDWLDMPGFSVEQWLCGKPLIKRLPSIAIVNYLKSHTEKLRIRKRFKTGFRVTSIRKVEDYWITEGRRISDNRPFVIKSQNVVLACGKTAQRKLGILREEELEEKRKISYDVKEFKRIFSEEPCTSSSCAPVIVVGDGISSVDCVRHCLENEIPVIHVMRRSLKELRNVMMSRLSPIYYSEYTKIYQMMIGRVKHPNYRRFLDAQVVKIDENSCEIMQGKDGRIELPFSHMAVCIGRESTFDQIIKSPNSYNFHDYRSLEDETLFAVGSYAGDHFVRFLVGGCLRVGQHLLMSNNLHNNNNLVK
ncbi:unnamed protein product [Caenorhabditis angaria]|uniref:Uncharacterized protein n=1 Tax=Caenorhabditis angaria TaxID=860376 RepID=A0A9P1N1I3_9PELO|nr:unnamed protein product [Caenorhabditis angaria]